MKLRYLLLTAVLLFPAAAIAGVEGNQTDSQSDILNKLSEQTDGAVLIITQGPTEAGSTVKVQIKDSAGNVVASITADGRVGIRTSAPVYPLDVRGDIFMPQHPSEVDCDGSATTGKGTCEVIADGAALVPLTGSNADLDGNGIADTTAICINTSASPTIVAQSKNSACPAQYLSGPTFTGTGLNNCVMNNLTFTDTTDATYTIVIDGTGTPNTFKWKKNAGAYTTSVSITGSAQTLSDGVGIIFGGSTGHTLNDQWVFTGTAAQKRLLGSPDSSEIANAAGKLSFKDSNSNGLLDDGEDLYSGAAPADRYSSTSTVIHGAVVIQ